MLSSACASRPLITSRHFAGLLFAFILSHGVKSPDRNPTRHSAPQASVCSWFSCLGTSVSVERDRVSVCLLRTSYRLKIMLSRSLRGSPALRRPCRWKGIGLVFAFFEPAIDSRLCYEGRSLRGCCLLKRLVSGRGSMLVLLCWSWNAASLLQNKIDIDIAPRP